MMSMFLKLFIGPFLVIGVKPTVIINHQFQVSVLDETRDADSQIREATKLVQPQVEAREQRTFGIFGAISYYTWLGRRDGHFVRRLFWIKVRYDDGIMHVKVEELLINVGEFTVRDEAVVEDHTGKSTEELLLLF